VVSIAYAYTSLTADMRPDVVSYDKAIVKQRDLDSVHKRRKPHHRSGFRTFGIGQRFISGGGGIRTHGTLAGSPVFETGEVFS